MEKMLWLSLPKSQTQNLKALPALPTQEVKMRRVDRDEEMALSILGDFTRNSDNTGW